MYLLTQILKLYLIVQLFTDMLPQQLVCKYELNCEYSNVTLAKNEVHW